MFVHGLPVFKNFGVCFPKYSFHETLVPLKHYNRGYRDKRVPWSDLFEKSRVKLRLFDPEYFKLV